MNLGNDGETLQLFALNINVRQKNEHKDHVHFSLLSHCKILNRIVFLGHFMGENTAFSIVNMEIYTLKLTYKFKTKINT